jgi:hypothetical protein
MSSSEREVYRPRASSVTLTEDSLIIDLIDGRTISAPIAWFPRLAHATPEERADFELIADGIGIHWPQLDEDISVEGVLAGHRSGESQASLQEWLRNRGRAS